MHRDETWQTYYPNGDFVVGAGWGAVLNNPEETGADVIVGAAVVFLYRYGDKGLELLWQKRSEKVDRFPGEFDVSAGGHINLNESATEAAVRETREEIGVEISEKDLRFVVAQPFNRNRFIWVYLVDFTGRAEDFHFDDGEVSEVRWVPFEETNDFRLKYAKAPLKEMDLTFGCIKEWFLKHGVL